MNEQAPEKRKVKHYKWTDEAVIEELRRTYIASGLDGTSPLYENDYCRMVIGNRNKYTFFKKKYGFEWADLCAFAGLPIPEKEAISLRKDSKKEPMPKKETKNKLSGEYKDELVIEELRRAYILLNLDGNEPMRLKDFFETGNHKLYFSTRIRKKMNWSELCVLAGLPATNRRKEWTVESIIEELRKAYIISGLDGIEPLYPKKYFIIDRKNRSNYNAMTRTLKMNWSALCDLAGLPVLKRRLSKYSDDDLIQKLKQAVEKNEGQVLWSKIGVSYGTYVYRFGSLPHALKIAGIEPSAVKQKRRPVKAIKQKGRPVKWTREETIECLRRAYIEMGYDGVQPMTSTEYQASARKPRNPTIAKVLGTSSWEDICSISGLPKYTKLKYSDKEIIAVLKKAKETLGDSVTYEAYAELGLPISNAYITARFGSWQKACRAAGIEVGYSRPLRDILGEFREKLLQI